MSRSRSARSVRAGLAGAYERCRLIHRDRGRSYYRATALLPAERRPAVHALYAFTRTADDIVDRTVARFAGRLGSGDDRAVLRQTAHTVARTLLAGPVSYLRSNELPTEAIETLIEAFGIGDDA